MLVAKRELIRRLASTSVAVVAVTCAVACTSSGVSGDRAGPTLGQAAPVTQATCMTGLFHIIQNGEPRYFLADDQGRQTRLLLDDDTIRRVGGALRFNRKRVTVVGERMDAPPDAIRVVSIKLVEEDAQPCQYQE